VTELTVGRRERKNQQTRARITRAAVELTLERGYDRATIGAIAERADVSRRTVHTWFRSKDDIILGELEQPLKRLEEELRTGPGDTVDRIERWLHAEGRTVAAEGDLARLRLRALGTDSHLRSLERERLTGPETAIAEAIAADTGAPPDSLAARAFAAATISILLGLRERYITPETTKAPDDLAEGFRLLRGAHDALQRGRRHADD
jgi:AcrR family transcriptional regulator